MDANTRPDDFAQGRILALRTAVGVLTDQHPDLKQAAREIARRIMQAESKWLATRASDLFIEGIQAESNDLQALINKRLSLRVPKTPVAVPQPKPRAPATPQAPPPDSES